MVIAIVALVSLGAGAFGGFKWGKKAAATVAAEAGKLAS